MVFKHMFNHCLYKLLHFYGSTGGAAMTEGAEKVGGLTVQV